MLYLSKQPIFILGCQRSGTTLLWLILGCHNDIISFDEDISELEYLAYINQCMKQTGPKICCIKCPRLVWHGDWFKNNYPKAHYIHIIREPKDVVVSMLKLEIPMLGRWIERWCIIEGAKHRMPLDDINEVERTAQIWRIKNELLYDWPLTIHKVSYETLTQEPELIIKKLCHDIELSFTPKMLQHHIFNNRGIVMGNTDSSKPIAQNSGKWLDVLSDEQIKQIDYITRETYDKIRFG